MLILSATTHILQVTTSTSQSLDYTVSYVDIDTASTPQVYMPGSGQGNIASATTTTILAAPGASTQRQVKQITLTNAGASANNVTVVKDVSATEYELFPTVTLAANESLVYQDGSGWKYFSATGVPKAVQDAAGSDTQIQYNASGALAGSSNLTYSSGTLGLAGTTAQINLTGVSATPSAPSSGILTQYAQNVSGRMLPFWRGPDGTSTPFQPGLLNKTVVFWSPNNTALGSSFTQIAAGSTGLPTVTNKYTMTRRTIYNCATGANTQNGLRNEAMFFRGNAAGIGGFFFFCRFGFETWTSNNRLFVGLTTATTGLTTGNPSSLQNLCGFGIDQGNTAITFMHNDASGTATKDSISGQPTLATNQGYDAYIFCYPNDSTIYYRLDDLLTGSVIIDTSTSSDLPVNTQGILAHAAIGSGSNTGASVARIGIGKMYIETDY